AAPEHERPELRHGPGLLGCNAGGVQQGERALMEDRHGERARQEADDETAPGHTPAIIRAWAKRRSGMPRRRSCVTGCIRWRRSMRELRRSAGLTSWRQPKYAAVAAVRPCSQTSWPWSGIQPNRVFARGSMPITVSTP